jgi:taurine dioxygenase
MTVLTRLRTTPLRADTHFGAEIHDVDLRTADRETLQAVVDEFHHSGAIVLRGQEMRPQDLIDFVSLFGEPEDHTNFNFRMPGFPKIYMLSNKLVNGKPLGSHRDGQGWHTDYSYKEKPVMSTMLYAVQVPPEGSDTLLADGVAAYNALPAVRQEQLQTLRLHHSWVHFMETREGGTRMTITDELRAQNPDVIHPLIRSHPADGRKALWVSTGTVKAVIGQDDPTDLALLDELVAFATQEQFVYRHKWQVGDILMWDNRCTLHTGTPFDETKYIREAHRLWVRGDKPY